MHTEQILRISRAIWIFIIHICDCAIVYCVLIQTFQNMRHGLSRWELENYTLAHNFLYSIFCIKNHQLESKYIIFAVQSLYIAG
jgi:hypothetical protein